MSHDTVTYTLKWHSHLPIHHVTPALMLAHTPHNLLREQPTKTAAPATSLCTLQQTLHTAHAASLSIPCERTALVLLAN